jgi:hypothetical protein
MRCWFLTQPASLEAGVTKEEAMQHGLGYASGREDGSNVRTVDSPGTECRMGWMHFAEAYAQAWDDFNHERRGYMTNCRDAYDAWQASEGRTIFKREIA